MIYIDEYLLINFVFNYLLLYVTSSILKINVNRINIIISSLISELSIISLFINMNYILNLLFKIVLCLIMIYISFGFNDYKSFIINYIYYNLINFLLGGLLFYFKTEGIMKYKYYFIISIIFMNIFKEFVYNLKKKIELKYKVTIYLNDGKILYLDGYMDSANTLTEPYTNKKVIIINKEVNENFYLVPYKTINDISLIKCFNPKKVYIDGIGQRNDISVGIVNRKFNGYNCLLNYKLMEE